MKKILIIFSVLVSSTIYAQSQEIISNDSLLKLFQVMKPFEVFEKIRFSWFDFKSCYIDSLLKPYLMKWLDRKEYFNYVLEQEKKTISNRPDWIKDEIIYMLNKQNRREALDSILNDSVLYSQYRDSAISVYISRYFESYKGEHKVPDRAIMIHSYLAYPESYAIIKQWWVESGKPTERNEYFIPLVRMGDPEAQELYDNRIKQFVKTNGEIPDLSTVYGELTELNNSYSIMKMIEILSVDKNYIRLSEGDPGIPFNCEIVMYLLGIFTYYFDIATTVPVKQDMPCKKNLKHLPEIKAAAKKLIEKYKAEEYYWMKNMPFYKKE
ncbi:hypothetical protein [Tenuifilum thalassicum]|uniref:Uncharacterized protein n=1 Tax=Tenuifilum thalassicum TaxID=2590900 RepID=A0A7D3XMB9_9BACT|nr:hypothetical protein [Tenuifilum thalassicum]QKG81015.1 hypothetical protein FHG85_12325 [Tenuifilum thalassicum]